MSATDERERYSGFAILELFGHRVLAGHVDEIQIAGAGFIRIRVPGEGETWQAEQCYSPQAVYSLTPATEAMAREMARRQGADRTVTRLGLPEPLITWPCQTDGCLGRLAVPQEDSRVRCYHCDTLYAVERTESGVLFHRLARNDDLDDDGDDTDDEREAALTRLRP